MDRIRLKVVSPIRGMRFILPGDAKSDAVRQTEIYEYQVGDILDLAAAEKTGFGRVTQWRVSTEGRDDVIITENELNAWRHECVIEIPVVAMAKAS